MILNENDFKAMGFDVVVIETPVTLIAGKAMVSRVFAYDTIDEMKQQDWFKDALNLKDKVPLFMHPLKVDKNKYGICFRMFWLGEIV